MGGVGKGAEPPCTCSGHLKLGRRRGRRCTDGWVRLEIELSNLALLKQGRRSDVDLLVRHPLKSGRRRERRSRDVWEGWERE